MESVPLEEQGASGPKDERSIITENDFRRELALTGDKIVEHDRAPFLPHSSGRLFLPDDCEDDIGMVRCKRKMLQCTIATSA